VNSYAAYIAFVYDQSATYISILHATICLSHKNVLRKRINLFSLEKSKMHYPKICIKLQRSTKPNPSDHTRNQMGNSYTIVLLAPMLGLNMIQVLLIFLKNVDNFV